MRILVLSDLPHFVHGGAEVQASRLISCWVESGHQIECLGREMRGSIAYIDERPVPIGRIPMVRRCGRWIRALTFFMSLCAMVFRRRNSTDVVYCRFLGEAAATVALLKSMKLISPVLVVTPANVGGRGDLAHLRTVPGWRHLVKLIDAQIDALNLIAPAMVDEFGSIGFSPARFTEIPNGVPVCPRARVADAGSRRRWLLVGRLSEQKGIDILIQALSLIPVRDDSPEFVIVGDGPERQRLTSMAARSAWADRIRFVGGVEPEQVASYFEGAELFLLPSRYEGMANAGLEAMSQGLPILLTATGGLDRFVDSSCGWVATPNDVDNLRCALTAAMQTPTAQLAAMGACSRRVVEEQFEMRTVADRYLVLFEGLLSSRGRTRSD